MHKQVLARYQIYTDSHQGIGKLTIEAQKYAI